MCKYKIDTGSGENIMHIKMIKAVFPYTKITNLNRSADSK